MLLLDGIRRGWAVLVVVRRYAASSMVRVFDQLYTSSMVGGTNLVVDLLSSSSNACP